MLTFTERAVEIARAIGHERYVAWAEERRGSALSFLGRPEEAREALQGAIPLLEAIGDFARLQTAVSNLGEAHRIAGELEDSIRYYERALEICERVGNPSYVAFTLINLGQSRIFLGQWADAREDLERAEEVLTTVTSASNFATYSPSLMGQLLLCTGDWDRANMLLERALGMAEAADDRQVLDMTNVAMAELEVLRGQPEAAIARLTPFAEEEGALLVSVETTLAWAYHDLGEVEPAQELAIRAVQRARDTQEVLTLVDALRVCGMVLKAQQPKEAAGIFDEGLELSRSLPYPYAEGRILFEMGMIDDAQAIFRRLGAAKDIERTERALAVNSES